MGDPWPPVGHARPSPGPSPSGPRSWWHTDLVRGCETRAASQRECCCRKSRRTATVSLGGRAVCAPSVCCGQHPGVHEPQLCREEPELPGVEGPPADRPPTRIRALLAAAAGSGRLPLHSLQRPHQRLRCGPPAGPEPAHEEDGGPGPACFLPGAGRLGPRAPAPACSSVGGIFVSRCGLR